MKVFLKLVLIGNLSFEFCLFPARKAMGDPSLGESLDINDKRSGIECQRIG